MATITREWLQKTIADMESARDDIPFGLDEDGSNTLAAFKLALASMEAEPVAWQFKAVNGNWISISGTGKDQAVSEGCEIRQLYTAPPAPEVPDEMMPQQASRSYCGEVRGYRDGWNACRAAMLQGGK